MISIIRSGAIPSVTCGSRVIDGLDNNSSEIAPVAGVKKIIMIKKLIQRNTKIMGLGI